MVIKLTIDITKDDIKNGRKGSTKYCPIANSLKRLFPNALSICVRPYNDIQSGTWWTARISNVKSTFSFDLNQDISNRASKFDLHGIMEPFTFDIEI